MSFSYYEKIGEEVTCIDDEIPFEIPSGWVWTRISDICIINPRNTLPDDTTVSFVPMPLIQEGFENSHQSDVKQWGEVKNGFTHFCENDIGIAKITPCFENRKSVIFRNLNNGIGAGTTELHILRVIHGSINPEYVLWLAKTDDFINGGVRTFSSAVGQQRVSKGYISSYLIPLPPYKEQCRICSQVNEAMNMIKRIEASLS